MWYWLYSSKVRLGLLVNGLYLLSLLVPSPSQTGGHVYDAGAYDRPGFARSRRPPVTVGLPPSKGPTKATSYRVKGSDSLAVYLDKDLTLQETPGRRLLLAPTFTVRDDEEQPDAVLLRFIAFSDEPAPAADNRFYILADGRQVWPAYGTDGGAVWEDWNEQAVPPSVTHSEEDGFIENFGRTIPYEVFAEAVAARRVTLSLGPYFVRLSAEQLEALRDMHRLWSNSRTPSGRPKRS